MTLTRLRPLRRPRFGIGGAALLVAATTATVGFGFVQPAGADDSGSTLSGYTASIQALGVQIAFDIPGIVPLPNQNLLEEDVPFTRTAVSNGPVVNSLGAPYYPGDILANFGSLLSEFAPPGSPAFPNDPLLADANYPPAPGHGTDESFGGNPPAGTPIAPNVFSATAHAGSDGGNATATLTDVSASAPSGTSSSVAHLGPSLTSSLGKLLSPLGTLATSDGPALDVGSVQTTNKLSIGASSVTGTAASILKAIDIAGVLDISQITSEAGSTSDGTKGTPTASLHLGDVTVDGQPAYVDQQGVHVSGTSTSSSGVTPAQAQNALDSTFAQDGISVRLLDPQMNTNGAEGTANSGGLVVSLQHNFAVPYIPGEPTIPVPELGNVGLPAGTYAATTSMTLGLATSDVQAVVAPGFDSGSSSTSLPGVGDLGLGLGGIGSEIGLSSGTFGAGTSTIGPSSNASGVGPQSLGERTSSRLPFGIPAPLGWLIAALFLCVVMAYPMLLAARWQFLSGRGR